MSDPVAKNGRSKKIVQAIQSRLPKQPVRLMNSRGGFNVAQLGSTRSKWSDLYHSLLTISWWHFVGLLASTYLALNALFALVYLLGGDGIANARSGSFVDAFFFSVQTTATIGYGGMYPKTAYANAIVTLEAIVGLFWITLSTGLMFARFSRPTARVLFSRVAVVGPYNGIPTLMFRAANQRGNQILEAQMRLTLVRNVMTPEGEFMRRFYDMALERSQTPLFALTWLVLHPIDDRSPLYGMTLDDLAEVETELIVTLSGTDETFSQTIHARHSYVFSEILWNCRFVDILTRTPDGRRAVDYRYFHEVISSQIHPY